MELILLAAVIVGFIWYKQSKLGAKVGTDASSAEAPPAFTPQATTWSPPIEPANSVASTVYYIDADMLEEDLEHAHSLYKEGLRTLDQYAATVERYRQEVEKRWADDSYNDVDDLERADKAIDWRQRWIDKQRWSASVDAPDIPSSGKWARFSYSDRDGAKTQREIVNWEKRGAYIVGYDRKRQEERTFRQDRIGSWQSG